MWVRDWVRITVRLLHTMASLSIVGICSYSTALFEYLRFSRGEQPSICQGQQDNRDILVGVTPLSLSVFASVGGQERRGGGAQPGGGKSAAVLLENKPEAYGPSNRSDPSDSVVACV